MLLLLLPPIPLLLQLLPLYAFFQRALSRRERARSFSCASPPTGVLTGIHGPDPPRLPLPSKSQQRSRASPHSNCQARRPIQSSPATTRCSAETGTPRISASACNISPPSSASPPPPSPGWERKPSSPTMVWDPVDRVPINQPGHPPDQPRELVQPETPSPQHDALYDPPQHRLYLPRRVPRAPRKCKYLYYDLCTIC